MARPRRISREDVLAKARTAFDDGANPSMDEIVAATGVSRATVYELFGSRAGVLHALGAPTVDDRIVAAGAELLADGLARLSLDEVSARSGVSRATVYRMYPGKAALFRRVVQAHLPMDEALQMMEASPDRPPAEVMRTLAKSLTLSGRVGIGVLRSAIFESMSREPGTEEVVEEIVRNTKIMCSYLEGQMAAGQLRTMDPLLAVQSFLAPIMIHVVSRPLVADYGLSDVSVEEAADEFTDSWLRAMEPAPGS